MAAGTTSGRENCLEAKHPCAAALSMKYFFDKYQFTSGGALGSLTLGLVVKELWRRRLPGLLASKVRPSSRALPCSPYSSC